MSKLDYWLECIEQSCEDHGVVITREQATLVAKDVEISHDNIGMAYYVPENPLIGEVKELKKKLDIERNKVVCKNCWGDGRITENYGTRSSNSQCDKCHGEGYVKG